MSTNMQHVYWAGGHILMFSTGLRYLLAWMVFKSGSLGYWYKAAFLGAFISYAIVVKKSLGVPSNAAWFTRALADENFQYFALCLFWLISKPVGIAIIPYWTFSAFHVATFIRTTVIPKFLPASPGPNGGPAQPSPIAKTIQSFVKKYYDPSMKLVAYVELVIFGRVLFGLILRRNSLLMPIIYGIFLRSRYFQSPFTRQAFARLDAAILQGLQHPQVAASLPQVKTYYDMFKGYLGRAMGTVLVADQPPRAAPATAAASQTSVTFSLSNLFHGIFAIFAGLFQSVLAVGTSILALAQNIVQAAVGIFSALVTAVFDLMSSAVGFVLGNIFIILALGAAYWFYATQTASGRAKTSGGRKNPLK